MIGSPKPGKDEKCNQQGIPDDARHMFSRAHIAEAAARRTGRASREIDQECSEENQGQDGWHNGTGTCAGQQESSEDQLKQNQCPHALGPEVRWKPQCTQRIDGGRRLAELCHRRTREDYGHCGLRDTPKGLEHRALLDQSYVARDVRLAH